MATILALGLLSPAGAAGTFTDDDGNVHEAAIERIAALGITRGCNPPTNDRYCPADSMTRGQMAAFLVRTFDLTASSASFTDTAGHVFEADIARLATAGVTRGCNPPDNTRFCPDDLVTRGQMAAFLVRALGVTDLSATSFTDTAGHLFEADISRLAAAGITKGCDPPDNTRFCPDQAVRRDEMATFLSRTFDIFTTGTTTSSTVASTSTSTSSPGSTSTSTPTSTTAPPPQGWATMEPLDELLTDADGDVLDNRLYLAGGKRSATERVDDFLVYDPATDRWDSLDPIPDDGREDVSLVAVGSSIYVFGGASESAFGGNITAAAHYDGTWQPVEPLPDGRSGMAAVAYGGDIWLIGGFDQSGNSMDTVLIYDPDTDKYTDGPELPSPRDHAAAAVIGGELFLFGGRNRQNGELVDEPTAVLRLTSSSDTTWEPFGDPMLKRRSFVVGVANGRFQLFGGESSVEEAIAAVEEFDPGTGSVLTIDMMENPRHGPAGGTIGASTYVVGGSLALGADEPTHINERFTR